MLTTRLEKHLMLDDDFNLHIFWDFNSYIGRDLDLIRHHFFWDRGATDDIIAQFPYFGARMVHLLEQMEYWKPRTPNELLIPGYPDRMV